MNTEPHDLDAELERQAWAAYTAATDATWRVLDNAFLDAWEVATSQDDLDARIAGPHAAWAVVHEAAWPAYLEQIQGTRFADRHQPRVAS